MALRLWSWCRNETWQGRAHQTGLSNLELTLVLPPLKRTHLVPCNVWDVTKGLCERAQSDPNDERQELAFEWGSLQVQGLQGRVHLPASTLPPSLPLAPWCHPPGTVGGGSQTLGGSSSRDSDGVEELCVADVSYRTGFKGDAHKRLEAGVWQIICCFRCSQHTQAALGRYMCISQVCAFFQ